MAAPGLQPRQVPHGGWAQGGGDLIGACDHPAEHRGDLVVIGRGGRLLLRRCGQRQQHHRTESVAVLSVAVLLRDDGQEVRVCGGLGVSNHKRTQGRLADPLLVAPGVCPRRDRGLGPMQGHHQQGGLEVRVGVVASARNCGGTGGDGPSGGVPLPLGGLRLAGLKQVLPVLDEVAGGLEAGLGGELPVAAGRRGLERLGGFTMPTQLTPRDADQQQRRRPDLLSRGRRPAPG